MILQDTKTKNETYIWSLSDMYSKSWSFGRVPLYEWVDNEFHIMIEGIVGFNRLVDIGKK